MSYMKLLKYIIFFKKKKLSNNWLIQVLHTNILCSKDYEVFIIPFLLAFFLMVQVTQP